MNARSLMLRTLTAALAIAGASLPHAARADAWWTSDTWSSGQAVRVQVRVDGSAATLYASPTGDSRRYFEAFAGRNYSLVVTNTTGQRLGVLIAVDGLNVVSGERSRLSPDEQMYVLGPWESATIQGWRTSLRDVRRFVFVDEQHSYASRTGQANGDMGWIRVLSFREQQAWFAPRRIASREMDGGRDERGDALKDQPSREEPRAQAGAPAAPAPLAKGEAKSTLGFMQDRNTQESTPGTGWGDRRSDPVQLVDFTPQRAATDQLVLRYEYASGLRALGIYRRSVRDRVRERDRGELGFAQPPRW
jgi:hypothetical protein